MTGTLTQPPPEGTVTEPGAVLMTAGWLLNVALASVQLLSTRSALSVAPVGTVPVTYTRKNAASSVCQDGTTGVSALTNVYRRAVEELLTESVVDVS